jgi:ArsR family transcriptional regulator
LNGDLFAVRKNLNLEIMMAASTDAAALLKVLSHEHRLLILCFIGEQEKSVQEIEHFLGISQSAVSQQLAKLRDRNIVGTRRDGKNIYYSIKDPHVGKLIETLQQIFCAAK